MSETNTSWQDFKKRARPASFSCRCALQNLVLILPHAAASFSSWTHWITDPERKKTINNQWARCWNGSQPFLWVNPCEGQCLPMCNKAAQTLLQHPAFCGICYLRWGFEVFGHVYTARGERLCVSPHSSGKWITKKKAQLVNTGRTAKVTYSHASVPFRNCWSNLCLIKKLWYK